MTKNPVPIGNEKTLKVMYAFCVGQFLFVLFYVNFFCYPKTQLHVALVGLSASCGLLLAGISRRRYHAYSAYKK